MSGIPLKKKPALCPAVPVAAGVAVRTGLRAGSKPRFSWCTPTLLRQQQHEHERGPQWEQRRGGAGDGIGAHPQLQPPREGAPGNVAHFNDDHPPPAPPPQKHWLLNLRPRVGTEKIGYLRRTGRLLLFWRSAVPVGRHPELLRALFSPLLLICLSSSPSAHLVSSLQLLHPPPSSLALAVAGGQPQPFFPRPWRWQEGRCA